MVQKRDIIVTQFINELGVTIETNTKPLIHCKDCRHGQYDATHYFCAKHHHKVYEDDYCSHGQRLSNFSELAEQTEHKLPGHDEVIDALNKLTLRGDSE